MPSKRHFASIHVSCPHQINSRRPCWICFSAAATTINDVTTRSPQAASELLLHGHRPADRLTRTKLFFCCRVHGCDTMDYLVVLPAGRCCAFTTSLLSLQRSFCCDTLWCRGVGRNGEPTNKSVVFETVKPSNCGT